MTAELQWFRDEVREFCDKSVAPLVKQIDEEDEIPRQLKKRCGTEKNFFQISIFTAQRLIFFMGIPVSLYTPLFVCSRIAGWSAHIIEQCGDNRLIRLDAQYTGPSLCEYIALNLR